MTGSLRRPLSREETLDWLRLIRSENVGPITFFQLVRRFGSAAAALAALPDLAKRGGRRRPVQICPKVAAERELARFDELGVELLACGTPGYPEALAAIDDAPPLLAVMGHARLLQRPAVALVGARNASANGRSLARRLASELAADGFLVVSGLARGIDAAAHTGALDGGTAAAMAGGIDVVYPPENQPLYEEVAARGLLLSEMPPGTEPQARHFPRRNRLISGLSLGVLIVEAAPRSGSLITARLAGEQGREVMAVPGSPLDPRARGCNGLIRQGATLVESADDVRQALAGILRRPLGERRGAAFAGTGTDSDAPAADEDTLSRARGEVLELLGVSAVPVDEVIRQCQFSPAVVSTILLELELAGRCERHPGNRVALVTEGAAEASSGAAS